MPEANMPEECNDNPILQKLSCLRQAAGRSGSPSPATPYTPGPYTYYRDRDGVDDLFAIVTRDHTRWIATIRFWDEPEADCAERAEANARLISAAPELLDALHVADGYLAGIEATDSHVKETRASVKAAIARAERTEP